MDLWPDACLLISTAAVSAVSYAVHLRGKRRVRRHPLAPVIPLRTGHVRVIDKGRSA